MSLLDKFKKKEESGDEKQKAPAQGESKVEVAKKTTPKTETADKVEKKTPTKKVTKKTKGDAYKVLLSPIVSEKAAMNESLNTYTFKVAIGATKVDIKNAVAQIYGVLAKRVRVANFEGKKMRRGKTFGRRQDWKKAMITLPKGQSINIHEGV